MLRNDGRPETRHNLARMVQPAITLGLVLVVALAVEARPHATSPSGRRSAPTIYEHAEAEARLGFDKTSDRGDEATAAAQETLVRALLLNGRGGTAEALQLAQRSVAIRERLGNQGAALALSLVTLSEVFVEDAQFEKAVKVSERALEVVAGVALSDLDMARLLENRGHCLSFAGRHQDALAALRRALILKESRLPSSSPAIARTLEETALVLQRRADYRQSGPLVRRAASIQASADAEHPDYVRTLNLLAQQLWFEGQLLESRSVSESAVELATRALRPDHPSLAVSLRYLAATVADLGENSRSISLREHALSIAERNFGARHHVTAEYLHTLGHARLREGEYVEAKRRFVSALRIFEQRYGSKHEYVATTLFTLARAEAGLGDYRGARRDQERAMDVHARVGGPDHPYVANALIELAAIYRGQGALAEALPLLERALAIRERRLGLRHRDVARVLAETARTLLELDSRPRARLLADRAESIWRRLDATDTPDFASVLMVSGEIRLAEGDFASARSYFERAMGLRLRAFGTSHPGYAEAESAFAAAALNLRDFTSATRSAQSAEDVGRNHLRLMLRTLPERQALSYATVRPRGLDLLLTLSHLTPEAVATAFDALIRSRSVVLEEMAMRRRSSGHDGPGESARSGWVSAQQRLANLLSRGAGVMTPETYAAAIEHARNESDDAEEKLAAQSRAFRASFGQAQVGLTAVAAALAPEDALLSFVRFERNLLASRNNSSMAQSVSAPATRRVASYMAFVLRSGRPPTAVDLGPAQVIDDLIAHWRGDITRDVDSARGPLASRQSGRGLAERVWTPVSRPLQGARRVYVVPDASLNLLPLAALPVGESYLVEGPWVLHYLPAERDLLSFAAGSSPPDATRLLALGGATFDRADSADRHRAPRDTTTRLAARGGGPCATLGTHRFANLAATGREVTEVAALWQAHASTSTDGRVAELRVGGDASEGALKSLAGGNRVLHIATHGFFLGDGCAPVRAGTRSVGGLARPATRPTQRADAPPPTMDHPLLLSGLALAGANLRHQAGPDDDDGILTAEEVSSLDLEGTEWAVLSACDTGLGEIRAGEGVLGLRRAFQIAGVRTVIMSLWSVEDESTRRWMRALYSGRLTKGLDTATAVREASLEVLRERRAAGQSTHPFYWAAFVAAGDWH